MFFRKDIYYFNTEMINSYLKQYDSWKWNIEPTETWKELCKQRAQQIRDMYAYVIVYFSGGSDSVTVLNAFLDNNIKVDEVVSVVFDKISEPSVDGIKAEFDLTKHNYRGKYTKISITYDSIVQALSSDNFQSENQNFTGQLHCMARFNINNIHQVASVPNLIRRNNICHLVGECDPKIRYIDGHYYAVMDIKKRFISPCYHENTLFFTDSVFPSLHIKQCHMIARLMEKYKHLEPWQVNRLKHLLVRDFYSPLITPAKHADDPLFSIKFPNKYSEGNILMNAYIKHDNKFKDLYLRSTLLPQIKIVKDINDLTIATEKLYLLF